jgi:hypothetical protein
MNTTECEHEWHYYDGWLGYESLVCSKCQVDINDLEMVKGE